MTKKRLILLAGVTLTALLLAGLVGVTVVSAQEPTPETPAPFAGRGGGFGHRGGGRGMGGFGWAGGGQWTMFDTAAEALGLTPEEFFAELHSGKSVEEIAEVQGVELETLQEDMQAARAEAHKAAIEQAVEDGRISQEQAEWMLEGFEKGFTGGRGLRGPGFGPGRGNHDCPLDD